LQAKKITKLLRLAKLRKVKELLMDIRDMPSKTIPELREVLKKHKLRDKIFDKQREITEDYRHIIADESTARKGNFGEMATDVDMTEHGYKSLHKRIEDINESTHQGIDGIFEKDGVFYIVESKYTGHAGLSHTLDGRQMSDSWISASEYQRVRKSVGDEMTENIIDSGYERILAEAAPDGTIKYFKLNSDGYKISGRGGIFNP
ncbi:MAG: hypothetical protein WBA74_22715, partial [Cyclobacteriaceae bacterium]